MKSRLFLILILTVLMCLAGWTAHASMQTRASAKQNWEYMTVALDEATLTHHNLNHFGLQGWELVAVISSCPTGSSNCVNMAYLKRSR